MDNDNNDNKEMLKAKPVTLPVQTYWPFFAALGLVFTGWGMLTTWLFSVVGGIVFIISLIGWINIWRHERSGAE